MISPTDFKELLKSGTPLRDVFRDYVISDDVWLLTREFGANSPEKYNQLKSIIGNKLGVEPTKIYIVGGSKLGFSQNPHHPFREFDNERSDIDVVIINPKLFKKYADLLLENFYTNGKYVETRHMENVFKRFVNIKARDLDRLSSEFRDLRNQFGEMQSELFVKFTISNKLNFRIYNDLDAVEKYHIKGLEDLRRTL